MLKLTKATNSIKQKKGRYQVKKMLSEILSNTLSFETCITLYQGHISQSFHQPEGAGSGISDSKVN